MITDPRRLLMRPSRPRPDLPPSLQPPWDNGRLCVLMEADPERFRALALTLYGPDHRLTESEAKRVKASVPQTGVLRWGPPRDMDWPGLLPDEVRWVRRAADCDLRLRDPWVTLEGRDKRGRPATATVRYSVARRRAMLAELARGL